ncbi:MAG: cytochrome P450, partial [Myxococcales bacterium]|nr:cytochrome P450 [Myxococcales bacterium]
MARLDITSAAFHNDVHGTLTRLRHETAVASGKLFLIRTCYFPTRYADVDRLLHDGLLVKNGSNARSAEGKSTKLWMPPVFDAMMHNMLTSDEPDHRRLRNLVHKAFTPKRIAALDGLIERIADELLDELLRAGGGDLFTTFAQPLPVRIIAELIGIPAQDRDKFVRWTQAIARNPTPLSLLPVMVALRKFLAYIDALAEQRRRVPEDDLLTALVEAEAEGDRLTRQELRSTVLILLIAGHETT